MHRKARDAVFRAVFRRRTRLAVRIVSLRWANKLSPFAFDLHFFGQRAAWRGDRALLRLMYRQLPACLGGDHDELCQIAIDSDDGKLLGMLLVSNVVLQSAHHLALDALQRGRIARFWQLYAALKDDLRGLRTYLREAARFNQPVAFESLLAQTEPAGFSDAYWALLLSIWARHVEPAMVERLLHLQSQSAIKTDPVSKKSRSCFASQGGWAMTGHT